MGKFSTSRILNHDIVVVEISPKGWIHTNIAKAEDNSNFVFQES